jgi:type I restriction enzyme M protein
VTVRSDVPDPSDVVGTGPASSTPTSRVRGEPHERDKHSSVSAQRSTGRRAVWTACTALRNEYRDVRRYVESTAMLLFLKFLDARLLDLPADLEHLVPPEYRWSTLRALSDGDFSNGSPEVLQRLREFFVDQRWSGTTELTEVFDGVRFEISHPEVLGQAMAALDKVVFNADHDQVGDIYEFLIGKLSDAGVKGEFFTPRPVVDFIVQYLSPQPGARIWDPACGTGGFLARAYDSLIDANNKGSSHGNESNIKPLRSHTLLGSETDHGLARLARMNMILHGDLHPKIIELNSLAASTFELSEDQVSKPLPQVIARGGFDLAMANPPFGGHQTICDLDTVFEPWMKSSRPESNFFQLILHSLRLGGQCGVVLPEGILFRREDLPVRRWLLDSFNVQAVISLPVRTFEFAGIRACVIFAQRKTSRSAHAAVTWFGEAPSLSDLPAVVQALRAGGDSPFGKLVEHEIIDDSDLNLRPRKYLGRVGGQETSTVTVDDLYEEVRDLIAIEDDQQYLRITIQYHGRGAVIRDSVRGSEIGTRRQKRVAEGDLVVSKIDARNGALALIPGELDGAIVTSDFPIFRPKATDQIDPRLFSYYLQYGPYADILKREAQGTTNRLRVSADDIRSLPVPHPSQEDQAELLERLERQEAVVRYGIHLRDIAQKWDWLDQSAFDVAPDRAVAWSLDELIEDATDYVVPASEPDRRWQMLAMSNVDGVGLGEIRLGSSFGPARKYKKAVPGALAYALDRVNVGTVGIIPDAGPHTLISPYRVLFKCKDGLSSEWLLYLFKSPAFRNQIRQSQIGAVRNELHLSVLRRMRVPVPPVDDQVKAVSWIRRQHEKMAGAADAAESAEAVIKRIIRSLFGTA